MKEYLDIANSGYLYLWGGIILLVILVQAVLFIRLAWKEGLRIGMSSQQMFKGLRAGMVSSIIPSLPIVISLIVMSTSLGVPFPWMRLSIIGSYPYEILAAGIGAEKMGVEKLGGAGYTGQVFANSVWVMTIGTIWAGLMVFFFLKTLKKRYQKVEKRDPQWMKIITNAAFFGVVCVFLAKELTAGGVSLLTTVTGAVLMVICAILIKKAGLKWLTEFAVPISMIGALAGAVIFSKLL
jgi:hypothetical protein